MNLITFQVGDKYTHRKLFQVILKDSNLFILRTIQVQTYPYRVILKCSCWVVVVNLVLC